MKTILSICIIFLATTKIGIAQNFTLNNNNSENNILFPKLYLHTDREFYFQGDTLWFAAYYLNGKTNSFTIESCNLYSEIINQKGEIVSEENFILQNGFCS